MSASLWLRVAIERGNLGPRPPQAAETTAAATPLQLLPLQLLLAGHAQHHRKLVRQLVDAVGFEGRVEGLECTAVAAVVRAWNSWRKATVRSHSSSSLSTVVIISLLRFLVRIFHCDRSCEIVVRCADNYTT